MRYAGQVGIDNLAAIEIDGVALTMTNSIERDGVHVGLIALTGSAVTLTSDVFVQNQGDRPAARGRIHRDGGEQHDRRQPVSAIILDWPTVTLVNNLITNNSNTGVIERGPTNLTMSYNDVFNPSASNGNYIGLTDPTGTNGNLSVNPQYCQRRRPAIRAEARLAGRGRGHQCRQRRRRRPGDRLLRQPAVQGPEHHGPRRRLGLRHRRHRDAAVRHVQHRPGDPRA